MIRVRKNTSGRIFPRVVFYSPLFFCLFLLCCSQPAWAIIDGQNADNVLGQPDFVSNATATTQAGMNVPFGAAYDAVNDRLFVVEDTNNRVLVFNVADITNGENAVNVLGQANFTANGSATTQSGMNSPTGVGYDGVNDRLFVADYGNNRVLVFDTAAITDGENAANVLGQANFGVNAAATTQAGMDGPYTPVWDSVNDRLFVPDRDNHRVLVYDTGVIVDGENAINVLGQTLFTTNANATTQSGMDFPIGSAYDAANSRLFVSEQVNNRVTVFDVAAITDGEAAVNVLGQSDFTSSGGATTQSGINQPFSLGYDTTNNRLFVADRGNNRVPVFDTATITNGENAVNVLFQFDYVTNGINLTRWGIGLPYDIAYDNTNNRVFVVDRGYHRVLVHDASVTEDSDFTLTLSLLDGEVAQPNDVLGVQISIRNNTQSTITNGTLRLVRANNLGFVSGSESSSNNINITNTRTEGRTTYFKIASIEPQTNSTVNVRIIVSKSAKPGDNLDMKAFIDRE